MVVIHTVFRCSFGVHHAQIGFRHGLQLDVLGRQVDPIPQPRDPIPQSLRTWETKWGLAHFGFPQRVPRHPTSASAGGVKGGLRVRVRGWGGEVWVRLGFGQGSCFDLCVFLLGGGGVGFGFGAGRVASACRGGSAPTVGGHDGLMMLHGDSAYQLNARHACRDQMQLRILLMADYKAHLHLHIHHPGPPGRRRLPAGLHFLGQGGWPRPWLHLLAAHRHASHSVSPQGRPRSPLVVTASLSGGG